MQPQAPAPKAPSAAFLNRRELFCQHYAAGAGGAEAVRRAGYSPNGAKQRACVLLSQPEIRLRIEALRAERRDAHQFHLADAIAVVDGIIADAVEHSKCSVALRAVEFKLKLHGVIRDKRIDFYSYNDKPSPDADLENLECNRGEEFDGLPGYEYAVVPPGFATPAPVAPAEAPPEIVTKDDPDTGPDSDRSDQPAATAASINGTAPTAVRVPPRPSHLPHDTGRMTFDDRDAAGVSDLSAGSAAMAAQAARTAGFPPEIRPS